MQHIIFEWLLYHIVLGAGVITENNKDIYPQGIYILETRMEMTE